MVVTHQHHSNRDINIRGMQCYRMLQNVRHYRAKLANTVYIMVLTAHTHGAFDVCTKMCLGSDSGHSPYMWDMAK